MRSELRDSSLHSRLLETSPHPRIGDRQATYLSRTGKDPIALISKRRCLPPGVQDCQHLWVNGDLLFGFRRFHIPHPLANDSSLDQKSAIQPIHIRPLECKSFTHSKSEGDQTSAIVRIGSSSCSKNCLNSSTPRLCGFFRLFVASLIVTSSMGFRCVGTTSAHI